MARETITLDKALFDEALANLLNPKSGPGEVGYAVGTLQAAALLAISAAAKDGHPRCGPWCPRID